ncbi:AlpA family transcriptional regulator [Moraxella nasovis]|uniref:helix-turn-helix transcriptional regulator n=1 Tax=Moraxella nasovis TaxID=2904121 RepID=UPI001F612296|nr:AlpA family transcriptional regulator [Moraxella nasovis]UNU72907.1 AlpA family transcriptional regulator [Moraxella nasovis]
MTKTTQTQNDTFHPKGISRIDKVCKMVGLSKSTIYGWIKQGKFPKPIKLSTSMSAWRNSDVLAWLDNLESADDLAQYQPKAKQ